jgi:hypothetical protein
MNKNTLDELFPNNTDNEWYQWGSIHDVVLDATWKTDKITLTVDQCKELFLKLPKETQGLAVSWGLGDTPFRDNVYEFVIENMDVIKSIVTEGTQND